MSSRKKRYAAEDLERGRGIGKRERELHIIEGLLTRLGVGDYSLVSGDKPDVIATLGSGENAVRIACEVHTLHSDGGRAGSDFRRFRERWIAIMSAALNELRPEGITPYCRVDFGSMDFGGFRNTEIAHEFAIAGRLLRADRELQFPRDGMPVLSSFLHHIRVIDPDGEGLLWWPSHLQTGTLDAEGLDESVRQAVNEKTLAARGYDWGGITERWLVLHAQGHGLVDVFGGARDIDLPPRDTESPFTRVIIWDKFSEDVWALVPAFDRILDAKEKSLYVNRLPASVRSFVLTNDGRPVRAGST
jgi:hypothetical protein